MYEVIIVLLNQPKFFKKYLLYFKLHFFKLVSSVAANPARHFNSKDFFLIFIGGIAEVT